MKKKGFDWLIGFIIPLCIMVFLSGITINGRAGSPAKENPDEFNSGKTVINYGLKRLAVNKANQQANYNYNNLTGKYRPYKASGSYKFTEWGRNPLASENPKPIQPVIGLANNILGADISKLSDSAVKSGDGFRTTAANANTSPFLRNVVTNPNALNNSNPGLSYPMGNGTDVAYAGLAMRSISHSFLDLMMVNDGYNEISNEDRINYTMNMIANSKASEVVFLGVLWNCMNREQTVISMKMESIKVELKAMPLGFINMVDTWRQGQSDIINKRLLSTIVKFKDSSNMDLKLDITLKQVSMANQRVTDSAWDAGLKLGFKF